MVPFHRRSLEIGKTFYIKSRVRIGGGNPGGKPSLRGPELVRRKKRKTVTSLSAGTREGARVGTERKRKGRT